MPPPRQRAGLFALLKIILIYIIFKKHNCVYNYFYLRKFILFLLMKTLLFKVVLSALI